MGAVLFTNEFPAAGISVFAELRYRKPMAGAIHEYDPDLIFPGSDAERAPLTVTYYILCTLYIMYAKTHSTRLLPMECVLFISYINYDVGVKSPRL